MMIINPSQIQKLGFLNLTMSYYHSFQANFVRKNLVLSQEYKANLVRKTGVPGIQGEPCTKKLGSLSGVQGEPCTKNGSIIRFRRTCSTAD